MIDADAHGNTVLLAFLHQGREPRMDALQFGLVLGFGIFAHFESLFIGVIAGIDAHFFDKISRDQRRVRRVVNVRNQGHIVAPPS